MDIPNEIVRSLEAGELSEAQLRELIRIEAESIGLTFNLAIESARNGTLPRCHVGSDVEFLIEMLP